MNTQEAAEKWNREDPKRDPQWNEKLVATYCRDGVVIDAEPIKKRIRSTWHIPDDAPEPLLTKKRAAKLLKKINEIHQGGNPAFTDQDHTVDEYDYLVKLGFCSEINWINHRENIDGVDWKSILLGVTITNEGLQVINEVNDERRITTVKKKTAKLGNEKVSISDEYTETTTKYVD